MPRSRSFFRAMVGVIAVGSLLVLSACAPEPQSTQAPTPIPTESPAPEPYSGPVNFIGDELDWLLLSAEEIKGMLPHVGDVSTAVPSLIQVSDGGGYDPVPSICNALIAEVAHGSIGARTVTWKSSLPGERDGWMHVLQFPDEASVQARMDQYAEAAEQCREFEYELPSSFVSTTVEGEGGVRAIAGSLTLSHTGTISWNQYQSYSSVGNVIVEMWSPFTGEPTFDTEAAAALLRDRATEARSKLIDELTTNPPVSAETPAAADPAAPWSDWQITTAGIGPVDLGMELSEAIAAVPGARVEEPEWAAGPTRLISPDGAASLLLWRHEEGTAVEGVSVGFANLTGDLAHDGDALPSADGVKVGDPVSAAIAAFPEGTSIRVVSSGEYFYQWSTREGILLSFRIDREATEDGAVITGIKVEDATLWMPVDFG